MRTHLALSLPLLVSLAACGGSLEGDPSPAPASASSSPGAAGDAVGPLSCAGAGHATPVFKSDPRVATSQAMSPALVTDGTYAYWAQQPKAADGSAAEIVQIVRALLAGGAEPEVLAPGVSVSALAVDSTHVWFAGKGLSRVPKAGGAVEVVVPAEGAIVGFTDPTKTGKGRLLRGGELALDEDHVYWMEDTDVDFSTSDSSWSLRGTHLLSVAKTGGVATVLTDEISPSGLVVDEHAAYWIEVGHADPWRPREPSLRSADKRIGDPGAGKVLASGDTWKVNGRMPLMALAGDQIVVASAHDRTIASYPKAGGPGRVLTSDQDTIISLAVGGGYAFWSTYNEGDPLNSSVWHVSLQGGATTRVLDKVQRGYLSVDARGLLVANYEGLILAVTCP